MHFTQLGYDVGAQLLVGGLAWCNMMSLRGNLSRPTSFIDTQAIRHQCTPLEGMVIVAWKLKKKPHEQMLADSFRISIWGHGRVTIAAGRLQDILGTQHFVRAIVQPSMNR